MSFKMGLVLNIVSSCAIYIVLQLQSVLSVEDHGLITTSPLSLQEPAVNFTLNRTAISPLYERRFLTTQFNITGFFRDNYSLSIIINDETYAIVYENATLRLPNEENFTEGAFTMQGKRLGLGLLSFYLHPTGQDFSANGSVLLRNEYEVVVLRLP